MQHAFYMPPKTIEPVTWTRKPATFLDENELHQPSGAVESIDCLQSCDISRTISCKLILCVYNIYIYIYIIFRVIERCGFGYLSKVLHLPSPSNKLRQPMCEGDSFLRSWLQLGSGGGSIKARVYSIPIIPFHAFCTP